jgi:hypothetical protein
LADKEGVAWYEPCLASVNDWEYTELFEVSLRKGEKTIIKHYNIKKPS